ncbi:hypothetical protein PAAG_06226 [Paracoccidioides lutzii Pb01]|uniref:Uncharacterized protein n=1 Tax=Paracoccidioides lutzii (strain ATCC MYA-826 / Pb01) TaxID=502779 RepID=C1H5N1_PARBA|nr:hypothetical protein PAAG_06226 [Paracoccidioides lutzii Pb01]EEH35179.2 hypothetical protein PAAG_06226 [Paracoccidioides lutzii Pb01]
MWLNTLENTETKLTCYNGWTVSDEKPYIFLTAIKHSNKHKGRNLKTHGFPPDEVATFNTPDDKLFKLNFYIFLYLGTGVTEMGQQYLHPFIL